MPIFAHAASPGKPVDLRCEHLVEPLGIDAMKPRLYWKLEDSRRGAKQTAYQVLVGSSDDAVNQGKGDVWDSGKVESDQSAHVEYGGPALESRKRYYWTVKVWDKDGAEAAPARATWWEMGLLSREDWKAKWVAREYEPVQTTAPVEGVSWIWFPGENAAKQGPIGARVFRKAFEVPAGKAIDSATGWCIGDDRFAMWINNVQVANAAGWQTLAEVNVRDRLTTGTNIIAISTTNDTPTPSGAAAQVTIQYADGTVEKLATGEGWKTHKGEPEGFTTTTDLSNWVDAEVLGPVGMQPWGVPGTPAPGGPAALLRKEFASDKAIKQARLYATALGSYRIHINGKRVGEDVFTPDWTDYRVRASYQIYDVTSLVKQGDNAIAAILGDGWYASGLGWKLDRFCFGIPPTRLLAQLEITHLDGSTTIIPTDETWKSHKAPILRSEIYAGETYDARCEQAGWDAPQFNDSRWTAALLPETTATIQLSVQASPPIGVTEEIKPKKITQPSTGVYIYDMGQNMVGWVKLKVKGKAGDIVRLRFAEILKPDGHLYRENLRRAEVTDTYTLKGDGEEVWEPHFTYHGFRFVEVTGYPGEPNLETIIGRVVHTAAPFSGEFSSSSELVNQIWKNTLWGQRGNFFSVPTDCPQRDERLGWTGDAQTFWRTAAYNMDLTAFTHKWMRDMIESQSDKGGFPNVVPRVIVPEDGAPAWGDAGVIVPYAAYVQYGDLRLLEMMWPAMEKWMGYIAAENPNHIWEKRRGHDFGDWVPANSETDKTLIATCYWGYDAKLMAIMADALGKKADVEKYRKLHGQIADAFQKCFVKQDGTIANGSQTCYVLPMHFDMLTPEQKATAKTKLLDDITSRSNHLSTGFLGTTYLMPVLSDNGENDVATTLLLNDTYPSWGYMIRKDATTIWERWNGDTGDPSMNSFNHFCYGAVSEWLYRYLSGIDTTLQAPGYKKIVIQPHPDKRIKQARARYSSIYGDIVSDWQLTNGRIELKVTIPANTSAVVRLRASDAAGLTEGGKPLASAEGVRLVGVKDGIAEIEVGAGNYQFAAAAR